MVHLPRNETTFRCVADSIPEYSILMLDAAGRIVGWSRGAERNLGFLEAEVMGKGWGELLVAEDDRDPGAEILIEARARGYLEREAEMVRQDRARQPVLLTVTAATGDRGEVQAFSVVARDLSQQREMEDALRDADARFSGIISISTDAIVSVDESQSILFFNHGAEHVFGYTAEEVLHQPLEMLIPGRYRFGHDDHVRGFGGSPVAARRMGERGQIAGLRKSGEEFPAEASISQYIVGGKRIFTAVLRDSTERQRTEEALARQAEELARSNAELEQFAYVASHDLQEPLRMIASYTQLLARRYGDKLDDDALEFIGYAVDGVTRMQSLINDLLAYSRVGTRGLTFSSIDVNTVVARVLVSLGPAIEEQAAVISCDELPTVEADSGQLGQLFQNLITNAIKFRQPDEPPRVHVGAKRAENEWIFSVRDNGIGIDQEYADRIFVIFQRLHSRSEYPGTGIGLAICKRIVERHGGRIWLESSAGQGSTFHFSIPDAREPR